MTNLVNNRSYHWIYLELSDKYEAYKSLEDLMENLNDQELAILGAHFKNMERLVKEAGLILGGPHTDANGLFFLFSSNGSNYLEIIKQDPLVVSGMAYLSKSGEFDSSTGIDLLSIK